MNKKIMIVALIILVVSIVGTIALNAYLTRMETGNLAFQSDVAGVTVTLLGPSEAPQSGVIGENRQFTFTNLPVGRYEGIATKDGYEPSHIVGLTINSGGWSTIPISLSPKRSEEQVRLSTSPCAIVVKQGSSGTITVAAASPNGYEGAVSFSCSLPPGVTESYSPPSVTLAAGGTASSTLTLTVSPYAAKGIYAVGMEVSYEQGGSMGLGFILQVI